MSRRHGMIEGVNVTPLTDVALTLLVILLITATFLNTEAGINVQLPPAGPSVDLETLGGIRVTIGAQGEVFVNGVQVQWEQLGEALIEVAGEDLYEPVVLEVDRQADYEHFFQAVDIARTVGLFNFTMASEMPPPPGQETPENQAQPSVEPDR